MTDRVIVLAVHGAPPRDFPTAEMAEFTGLHARVGHADPASVPAGMRARAELLERRLREWPRTRENDPFWAASLDLGERLCRRAGCPIIVGFNEFCAPDLDAALHDAAGRGAGTVQVVTPMLTRGGGHAGQDIPAAIARARAAHPVTRFVYAWPFDPDEVARFLAEQVARFISM